MVKEKSESEIQKDITNYLTERKIFWWRNNCGRKGYIRFGLVGSADIFALSKGKFITIEVKDKEGKIGKEQIKFMDNINANGGLAIVARSKDDIIKFLYRYL